MKTNIQNKYYSSRAVTFIFMFENIYHNSQTFVNNQSMYSLKLKFIMQCSCNRNKACYNLWHDLKPNLSKLPGR